MGTDKSLLQYHAKPQWKHLVDLLQSQVDRVFLSVREETQTNYPDIIVDKQPGLGPFGAILTALEQYPNDSFIVLATDLPFIDHTILTQLVAQRNTAKNATALQGIDKSYPEPLVSIWESKSLRVLHDFYKQGIYRPIRVLQSMPVEIIKVPSSFLRNINTLEEYLAIRNKDIPSI